MVDANMRIKLFFLTVSLSLHFTTIAQPYCTLPLTLKSVALSYRRLPPNETTINTFRFYYKTVVECGQSNTNELHDLIVLNTLNGSYLDQSWQLDSFSKTTGTIDPCVELSQAPCYSIYYYHADVSLGDLGPAPFGFIANTINCCRPGNAVNLALTPQFMDQENEPPPSSGYNCEKTEYPYLWYPAVIGNALVSFIHVTPIDIVNSSPQFSDPDTILNICQNRPFSYQIKVSDVDGDSVAFHFSTPRTFFESPMFSSYLYNRFPQLLYRSPYSEQEPAGSSVKINQKTGQLSGSIPDTGTYVITISVPEYRDGQVLDSITKDFFIRVYDCGTLSKPKASVPDTLNSCSDFTVHFPNNSEPIYKNVNFNNTTFLWSFGDGSTSGDIYPYHTYSDTGTFNLRLIIFPGLYCADTAYSKVWMYPFVQADFSYNDSCSGQKILFTNQSTSTSGQIDSTLWEIVEDSTLLFSSGQTNMNYSFSKAPQTYEVLLSVRNDKGCTAQEIKYMSISQSPYPLLSHDTILSRGTTLQLQAEDGNSNFDGIFLWWPNYGLSDPFIADPILRSTIDTTYHVEIKNRFGCVLLDSIKIKYYTGPDIYVPNAFTPNGDGRNDIFKPILVGISNLNYFRVFNSFGQLVYQTVQSGQGWDGKINGLPSAIGTYAWEAKGVDYTGKTIFRKGTVVLVR
jgi:gliding motility-associated-like protein